MARLSARSSLSNTSAARWCSFSIVANRASPNASRPITTASASVAAAAKASVKDADAFRAALAEATFDSVRGKFKFNTNHHPIQDFYVREVVKDADGVLTNKIIATSFTDHSDAYAKDCKL